MTARLRPVTCSGPASPDRVVLVRADQSTDDDRAALVRSRWRRTGSPRNPASTTPSLTSASSAPPLSHCLPHRLPLHRSPTSLRRSWPLAFFSDAGYTREEEGGPAAASVPLPCTSRPAGERRRARIRLSDASYAREEGGGATTRGSRGSSVRPTALHLWSRSDIRVEGTA